ncbi:acetolactate synthase 2 small subunit [Shimwellia pseudoproteus]|uniref:acetolactate synthase 2 small subunit n=1 Tax=Shimwellia pseudoproteus TaxID=570012 RepID=UPI0018ED3266|nr:acetolactate synthase 2 small subunit [Shimwellia pseudoproteus]MBJ3816267.1 acetolactate synthase 2 small subunit [Shimwellia pseudoproteus]
MMHHQLAVNARFRPETVERILRVVRHRGFQICAMNMETDLATDDINLELTVASLRPVELLFSQLSKLVDVARVEVHQLTSQSQQIRA